MSYAPAHRASAGSVTQLINLRDDGSLRFGELTRIAHVKLFYYALHVQRVEIRQRHGEKSITESRGAISCRANETERML